MSSVIVEKLEVGVFAENCYIVGCPSSLKSVVIDPGDEIDRIVNRIRELGLDVEQVFLTHGHIDHVKEVNSFLETFDVPVCMNAKDQFLLDNLPAQAAIFGLSTAGIPQVDKYIDEGDMLSVGQLDFSVLHTPGHSPGSVTYVSGEIAFAGDVLFSGSIGRTDLAGGDFDTLIASIKSKLFPLGDKMVIYPGHGPMTSIGVERQTNPFLIR